MLIGSVADLTCPSLFVCLRHILDQVDVYLKIEGLNVAGSIKLKTARQMLDDLENQGVLRPGRRIVESSSGNLGVALAILCADRHYPFTCVADPNMTPATYRAICALGGNVIIVRNKDENGGFLGSRLALIRSMLAKDPQLIWTNQYASQSNVAAHYRTTGREIIESFPNPSWIFVGAGTTGTLLGVSQCMRENSPNTRIVAVDSVGSVTFGGAASSRFLPGIGTSVRPPLADQCVVDRVIQVPEAAAVGICRSLARRGLLVGASTGSVLAAVASLSEEIRVDHSVIAISPDLGYHYLETLYDDDWLRKRALLDPDAGCSHDQRELA